jgi:hypothetical protein
MCFAYVQNDDMMWGRLMSRLLVGGVGGGGVG